MNKNKKLLLVMTAVLAGLLILYGILSFAIKASAENRKKAQEEQLCVISAEELTEISYTNESESLAFQKKDGTWECTSYNGWPINQTKLSSLEQSLKSLLAVRVIDSPKSLSEYGLDNPIYTVKAAASEEKEYELSISYNDDNQIYYLSKSGDDRVFTISGDLATLLDYGIFSYVEYGKLPTIDEESITAINLLYNGSEYTYKRTETEKDAEKTEYSWDVTKDKTSVSNDDSNIGSAKYDITQMVLNRCVAYDISSSDMETFGLSEPIAEIKVTYLDSDSNEQSFALRIGAAYDNPVTYYYAMLNDNRQVTLVDADNINNLLTLLASVN